MRMLSRNFLSSAALVVASALLLQCASAQTPYPGKYGIAHTDEEWTYLYGPCNGTLPANGLSKTACQTCMRDAAATSYAMLDKSHGCYDYCASANYFPASPILNPASCASCVTSANVRSAWGCQYCMDVVGLDQPKRDDCFSCVKSANATLNSNNTYLYSCAWCASLPEPYKTQCKACVAAQPGSGDFGKCVYQAQRQQAVDAGTAVPDGIEAQCFEKPNPSILSNASCITCMKDTMTLHPNGTFAYACSTYCQQAATSTLAGSCVTCVTSNKTTDPWACSNCMSAPGVDSTSCFTCLADDPYEKKANNYGWACGACASITDIALRNACLYCIKGQGAFNASTTESNICSCVDLTTNVGINLQGIEKTGLDAVERSCYKNHTVQGVVIPLVYPGDSCLSCMNSAGSKKRYACNQYCQDPTLVRSVPEGDACSACVADPDVTDPWACQNCMIVTSVTNTTSTASIRTSCFDCVKTPPNTLFANYAWGCGQCASLNATQRPLCFGCLAQGNRDPCVCVDSVKNGTYIAP